MLQNGRVFKDLSSIGFSSEMGIDQVSPAPPMEGLMWRPASVKDHQLTKLRLRINEIYHIELEDYHQLHKWSCDNYDLFWSHVLDICGIIHQGERPECAVDRNISIEDIPKWFPGIKLNYAENLLK